MYEKHLCEPQFRTYSGVMIHATGMFELCQGTLYVTAITVCLLLFFFVYTPFGYAAEIFQVKSGATSCVLGSSYVEYLEDKGTLLTIDDILQNKIADFQPLQQETPGFGFTSSVYWFKFSIKNNLSERSKYYLNVSYPLLDDIALYVKGKSGEGYLLRQTGDHFPFDQRDLDEPDFIFSLHLPPQERQEFYLRVQTSSSMTVPLLLCSTTDLVEHLSQKKMLLGLFLGVLLVMMIHNFFVFVSTGELAHLYYVLFVAANLLFQFTLNGMTFQFFWPEQIWMANNILPSLIFCCYLTAAQFSRTFLNSKVHTPLPDKILRSLNYFAIVGIVCSLFLDYSLVIRVATFLILTVPLFIYIGIRCLLLGNRPALYYCLGWSVSLLGYFVFALKSFGVLPQVFITTWGIQMGSSWEIILFSVALADRFQFIKKEKEDIQRSFSAKVEKANLTLTNLVDKLSHEIAHRQKVETALINSEQTARALIDTPTSIAFLLDKEGAIVDGNRTFADSLGQSLIDLVGTKVIDWYGQTRESEERRRYVAMVLETGEMIRFEDCLDGVWYDSAMNPILDKEHQVIGVSVLSHNISQRKEAERNKKELEVKAMNQEKLASLGHIATGIAHEINQPLSYIKIIFESTIIDLKNNRLNLDELKEDARESLRQLARITAIISHLRIFGRAECDEMMPVNLVEIFNNSMILMGQRLKHENIVIHPRFAESLPLIKGSQVKLEQIFINLLQNSTDSIKEKGINGIIDLNISADSETVLIEFSDNGIGLNALGDEIFEPFFTTKEPGKGTGLGLSIIYGIVQEHKGTIEYRSSQDGGATFVMTFPIANIEMYRDRR